MNSKGFIFAILILFSVTTTAIFANGSYDSPMGQGNSGFYGHGGGMGMHGSGRGMSTGWGIRSSVVPDGERLQMEEVENILSSEIDRNGGSDWYIVEMMEFDSNFYAQIGEGSNEQLVMEVLVDPFTGYVQPEFGPNMMWNTENSHRGGRWNRKSRSKSGELRVSEIEAIEIANEWLDREGSDSVADNHADIFPGYYTLHTLENDQVTGMLSVNGWDGRVWYHKWHGEFVGMENSHDDEDNPS